MSDNKTLEEKLLSELANKEDNSKLSYLVSMIATQHQEIKKLEESVEQLRLAVEHSELFFKTSEVQLFSKNKLPRVEIRASDVIKIGDNFYRAESFGQGNYFRWTGPDRLNNFNVPIDRTILRTMRLSIVNSIKPEILSSIKVYIDGELTNYDIEKRERGVELICLLPCSDRVQDTVISLFVPQLFSPHELDKKSEDKRKLGIAFHKLEVV